MSTVGKQQSDPDPLEPQRRRWRRPWRTAVILTIRGRRYEFDHVIEADEGNGRRLLLCLAGDEAAAVIEFFPLRKQHRRVGAR